MNTLVRRLIRCIPAVILAFIVLSNSAIAQEKKDNKVDLEKIYKEIAGDYEAEVAGQIRTLTFFIDESTGKLWGGPQGREVELTTTGDTGLKYEVTGEGATIEFKRDDKGQINSFTLVTQGGREFTGTKVKKKKDGGK